MLNSRFRARLEQLAGRNPLLGFLLRYTGRAKNGLDLLLAVALLSAWTLLVLAPLKLYSSIFRRGRSARASESRRILFLTFEGYAVAPARVRTQKFCQIARERGLDAETFSFWEDLLGVHGLYSGLNIATRNALRAIRAFHRLRHRNHAVIYQQRPCYDLITTLALRWINGCELIFDIDDLILDFRVLGPIRLRRVLELFAPLTDLAVVSSHHLEKVHARHFKRIVRIPTYVDTRQFTPATEEPPPPIVFSWNGTLFFDFNVDAVMVMVEAFARACGRCDDPTGLRLEVVGGGAYLDELRSAIAKGFPGLPIRVLGWRDPSTMPAYLHGVHVGLYSLRTSGTFKGLPSLVRFSSKGINPLDAFLVSKSPTKIFEYWAAGLPVISTFVGESGKFIEQGVTGFAIDDLEVLADAIVKLARDAGLRKRMGTAAREACVQRYSLESVGDLLVPLLAPPRST